MLLHRQVESVDSAIERPLTYVMKESVQRLLQVSRHRHFGGTEGGGGVWQVVLDVRGQRIYFFNYILFFFAFLHIEPGPNPNQTCRT